MAATVQFLINNVDYTPKVLFDTVTVDNNIIMTSDTMDFSVELGYGDTLSRPRAGQEVIWQNPNAVITAPGGSQKPYREFAGVITTVQESVDGTMLLYAVHVKSYVQWLDRHLVTTWYNQDKPENIIANRSGGVSNALIPAYANKNGKQLFTTYNVQNTGITVTPAYYDYRKLSECLKDLADQMEYGWYCDYYRDIHFFAAETFVSPLPNNTLDVENDVANYGDLVIEEDGEQVYNQIFIKGFKTRSTDVIKLTYVCDGTTNQWSTGYRLSSFKGDVAVTVYPSLSAYQSGTGGTVMTIARDVIDGAPGQPSNSNTAYIHYTQHLVRVPNWSGTGNPPPSGYVIAVNAHYLKDMVFLASDPEAQQSIASVEGVTDGVYEYAHSDKSLTNSTLDAVKSKGQLLLMKYGHPQIKGTFTTYFNATSTSGWRAGQYFYLKSTKRFGGSFSTPEVMFVQRVTKSIVTNGNGTLVTLYNIEFADSPYLV